MFSAFMKTGGLHFLVDLRLVLVGDDSQADPLRGADGR